MNEFIKHLEKTDDRKRKVKGVVVHGHKRVLKNGSVITVDPYMAVKTILKNPQTKITSDNPSKVGDLLTVLNNPNVNKKLKKMLLHHIEIHHDETTKHAKIKIKQGKLIISVNKKLINN